MRHPPTRSACQLGLTTLSLSGQTASEPGSEFSGEVESASLGVAGQPEPARASQGQPGPARASPSSYVGGSSPPSNEQKRGRAVLTAQQDCGQNTWHSPRAVMIGGVTLPLWGH